MPQAGVLGRLGAVRGAPGPVVRVVMVLNAAVGSDASLLRDDVSESTENGAPPVRASRNLWWRTYESGPATICARTETLLGL